MKRKRPKSKDESRKAALEQHAAVCKFLKNNIIRGELTESLAGSKQLDLLNRLLEVNWPIVYQHDDLIKDRFGTKSLFSTAVSRLNKHLTSFSEQFKVLKNRKIRIRIPSKMGGLQLGKYLTCQDLRTFEYLEASLIKDVLTRALAELKKKREKERSQRKKTKKRSYRKAKLHYLRDIRNVLRIGMPEEPRWFRKTGPIAADFDDGRVYLREEKLRELEALVMNNPVSMLEGIAATGKTVLSLSLAYRLYKEGQEVYYFDCDKKRDFDGDRLADEIRNAGASYLIIENIHLMPPKFQLVYSEFKHDQDRNMLFVSRPSYREFQDSRSQDLTEIATVKLEPFDEVDAIIMKYRSRATGSSISPEAIEEIRRVSPRSFWLLSYALEGCVAANEAGDPRSWLERGVKRDLNDIRNIDSTYPELLVALSPLYQNEVLTEESYLTRKLGFHFDALAGLVKRGQTTWQKAEDGTVFYGLPHSGLADAYWEHGQEYRRRRGIKEYEAFIYDYVAEGTKNALEAVVRAKAGTNRQVLKRLERENKLAAVIENERNAVAVASFLKVADVNTVTRESILRAIAQNMNESHGLMGIAACMNAVFNRGRECACKLLKLLDRKRLATNLSTSRNVLDASLCVRGVSFADPSMAHELCASLSIEKVTEALNQIQNVSIAGEYLSLILVVNREVALKLWQGSKANLANKLSTLEFFSIDSSDIADVEHLQFLSETNYYADAELRDIKQLAEMLNCEKNVRNTGDRLVLVLMDDFEDGWTLWQLCKDNLAARLSRCRNISDVSSCIGRIYSYNPNMAQKFCDLLDPEVLAERLNQASDLRLIHDDLCVIQHANNEVGQKLWALLGRDSLLDRFRNAKKTWAGAACVEHIRYAEPNVARELCSLLNVEELIKGLNQAEDAVGTATYIAAISKADQDVSQRLWELLDKKRLVAEVSQSGDLAEVTKAVQAIYSTTSDMAQELCGLLDVDHLLTNLDLTTDLSDVGACISSILEAHKLTGQKLWLAYKEKLADMLSRPKDLWGGILCIVDIHACEPDMAGELCELLDLEILVDTLNHTKDVSHIGNYIFVIFRVNLEVGRQLWQRSKKNLAGKLSHCGRYSEMSSCIKSIYSCDPCMAFDLCSLLSLEALADALNGAKSLSDVGSCVFTILSVNPKVGRQLWEKVKDNLSAKLSRTENIHEVTSCIVDTSSADPDIGREVCDLLCVKELTGCLNEADGVADIGECISAILKANSEIGLRIWMLLDKEKLAARLSETRDVSEGAECVEAICSVDSNMARTLCTLLDLEKVASTLKEVADIDSRREYLEVIGEANEKVQQKLSKLLEEND